MQTNSRSCFIASTPPRVRPRTAWWPAPMAVSATVFTNAYGSAVAGAGSGEWRAGLVGGRDSRPGGRHSRLVASGPRSERVCHRLPRKVPTNGPDYRRRFRGQGEYSRPASAGTALRLAPLPGHRHGRLEYRSSLDRFWRDSVEDRSKSGVGCTEACSFCRRRALRKTLRPLRSARRKPCRSGLGSTRKASKRPLSGCRN